jgi:hypothetical protein
MSFSLEDFFPKYPNIEKSPYPIMNPYEDRDFNQSIYSKKEFLELKLDKNEVKSPSERLFKHQRIISTYTSSHTPYDGILLVHEMGSGKTLSLLGSIEQIKTENAGYRGAVIITRNPRILKNIKKELADKFKQYSPEEYESRVLTEDETIRRINKLVGKYYTFNSFDEIQKTLSSMTDAEIVKTYSNMIIGIDEVHNLRQYEERKKEGGKEKSIQYNQIHRLMHLVKGCKKIIMSGTPMRDHPNEIAPVLNLVLPLDKQLPTGKKFNEKYLYQEDGVDYVKKDMKDELKEYMKGRVSFLKSTVDVETEYVGKPIGDLKYTPVVPSHMSEFQSESYTQAYKKDTSGKEIDDEDIIEFENDKEDGGTGVYSNSQQATLFVFPDGSYGLKGFKKYVKKTESSTLSGKKRKVISSFRLSKEFEQILRGNTVKETINNIRRYSALYADIIESILQTPDKLHFIYGSRVSGSGNILLGCLLDLVGYARARGMERTPALRYFVISSQTSSDKATENIIKFFSSSDNMNGKFINVLIGSKIISEGLTIKNVQEIHIVTPHWNYSELSQAIARGIRLRAHEDLIRAGQEPLIRVYQHVDIPKTGISIDLKRYELSERKDISMKDIERLVKESAFDCALTYNRNNISSEDGTRNCEYQECDYKCDGIDNMNPDPDYSTFNLYYSAGNVGMIITRIMELFRKRFCYTIPNLLRIIKDETVFNVFTSLNKIIYENREVVNPFGFVSYLREQNDLVFLVESLSSTPEYYPSNYAQHPAVSDELSYEGAFNNLLISKISSDTENLSRYIAELPENLQRDFIQNAILSRNIDELNDVGEAVLNHYHVDSDDYKFEGKRYCLSGNIWEECQDEEPEIVIEQEEPEIEIEIENPYGYSGTYAEDDFCIKKHMKEEDIKDPRYKSTGRACPKSWHIDELVNIAIKLQVPYKDSNKKFSSISTMSRDMVLDSLKLTKLKKIVDELESHDVEDLRRAVYFSSSKIIACNAIRKWFAEHDLLEYNSMCGVKGAKKK